MKITESGDLDEFLPSGKSTRDEDDPGRRDPGGTRPFGWLHWLISSTWTGSGSGETPASSGDDADDGEARDR